MTLVLCQTGMSQKRAHGELPHVLAVKRRRIDSNPHVRSLDFEKIDFLSPHNLRLPQRARWWPWPPGGRDGSPKPTGFSKEFLGSHFCNKRRHHGTKHHHFHPATRTLPCTRESSNVSAAAWSPLRSSARYSSPSPIRTVVCQAALLVVLRS